MGSVSNRIAVFLGGAYHSNGLFYSVIRRNCLDNLRLEEFEYYAGDWGVICFLASKGEIARSESCETIFSSGGLSNGKERYSFFRKKLIHWIYPLREFSLFVNKIMIKEGSIARLEANKKLAELNYHAATEQAKFEVSITSSMHKKMLIQLLSMTLRRKVIKHFLYRF